MSPRTARSHRSREDAFSPAPQQVAKRTASSGGAMGEQLLGLVDEHQERELRVGLTRALEGPRERSGFSETIQARSASGSIPGGGRTQWPADRAGLDRAPVESLSRSPGRRRALLGDEGQDPGSAERGLADAGITCHRHQRVRAQALDHCADIGIPPKKSARSSASNGRSPRYGFPAGSATVRCVGATLLDASRTSSAEANLAVRHRARGSGRQSPPAEGGPRGPRRAAVGSTRSARPASADIRHRARRAPRRARRRRFFAWRAPRPSSSGAM